MNRVKEFRKELGISQLELAKDIGTILPWNSVSISLIASKQTSTVSFGRTNFNKEKKNEKRNSH